MAIESKMRPKPFIGNGGGGFSHKRTYWMIGVIAVVLLLGLALWYTLRSPTTSQDPLATSDPALIAKDPPPPLVEAGEYQAVFLTNGQIYFGKLQSRKGDFIRLEEVYYLETRQNVQSGNPVDGRLNSALVKLGNEIHGPRNYMDINRDHVLFIEDLKGDSKIVQAIADHQSQQ